MTESQDLEMVRGDTLQFAIEIEGDIGTITDIRMTARHAQTDEVLFERSLSDGVRAESATRWNVRVPPALTAAAPTGAYNYDVQFTAGTNVYTPLYGTLRILPDVTRAL